MSDLKRKIGAIRWQQVTMILLMALLVAGMESCKSSGKLSKKERKAQIESAKRQLQPIINGTSTLSIEEQQRIVNTIRDKKLNDPELNTMIEEAEQKLRTAFAEQEKIRVQKVDVARAALYDLLLNKDNKSADELEKELEAIKAQHLNDPQINDLISRVQQKIDAMRDSGSTGNLPVKTRLENFFNAVVTASKEGNLPKAEDAIEQTLQLFSSPDATVLIIISREGSVVDYDKPTTIRRYLNLLKDTKTNRNNIDAIMTDSNGKIKELDLIKK